MKKSVLTVFTVAVVFLGMIRSESASAQNAILAEMYGQGVHAYYAGNHTNAYQLLSTAINNGIQDPRAYYFRGLVAHAQGRPYEAESDWKQGAELEASGKANASIGRSLARFQGTARLKLEEIRRTAKLQALAVAAARAQQRYGDGGIASGTMAPAAPPAPPKAAEPPRPAAPAPPAPAPVAPADSPFADDMAEGEPTVAADDALEDAMEDPFADDPAVPDAGGAADADANPFGGDAGGGADPFGGGDAGADSDPFGGGGDADPFGGGDDADPFGGDPFGN